RSGFTNRQLHPSEQVELLKAGYGITNLVNRGTATADELAPAEFVAGRKRLAAKVRRYRPKTLAFLGVGAYCHAFLVKEARIGPQGKNFEGAEVWVLPNPSGLNANYQLPDLVKLFRSLRDSSREKHGHQARQAAEARDRGRRQALHADDRARGAEARAEGQA